MHLVGFAPITWVQLLALTAGAQLLGHSLINVVLQTTSPTVVSLAILFEMPGAALIAAIWLGQHPPLGPDPGGAAAARRRRASSSTPTGAAAGPVEAPPG